MELGEIGVFLAARRGLNPEWEAAGLAALRAFFDRVVVRAGAAGPATGSSRRVIGTDHEVALDLSLPET